MYDMKAPPSSKPDGKFVVLSSQEVLSSQGEQQAKQEHQQQKKTQQPDDFVEWIDSSKLQAVRIVAGVKQVAPLMAGPGGFCIAEFDDGTLKTEVPNLLLLPVAILKKPAGVTKEKGGEGPAKECEKDEDEKEGETKEEEQQEEEDEEEEEQQEEKEEEQQEEGEEKEEEQQEAEEQENKTKEAGVKQQAVQRTYSKMWYKKGNAWGIRRKFFDKGQAFQVGGAKLNLSKEALGTIADKVIQEMENNDLSEAEAKQLAKEEVDNLK